MKALKGISAATILLSVVAMSACRPSGSTVAAPEMNGSTTKKDTKKEVVDNSSDQEQAVDQISTDEVLPQTVVPVVTTTTEPVITEQTIQQRYPNWVDPPQSELDSPKNAKIYNYTNEGIVSLNGKRLASTVPPGKAAIVPKLYDDLDNNDRYTVQIVLESGRSSTAKFEAMDVDGDAWRASVKDSGGTLTIEQNAGGGGGGGGNQQQDLQNFN